MGSLNSHQAILVLFPPLGTSQLVIDFAHTHSELIKTFGRFPRRHQILGKASTSAELELLDSPNAFHG